MTKNATTDGGEVELNMTPMIDVVFNLIIFFMLVTDLTEKELEELALPRAEKSLPDIDAEKDRVIINIRKAPDHAETGAAQILVKGVEYDLDRVRELLFAAAERRRAPGIDAPPSEVPVLIRCDRDVRWRTVQQVLGACGDSAVRIYKVEFATSEREGGGD